MTLGENIVRLRTQKNWSQGDLADALDISRQSVSKWETDASIPELDKLLKLSELFEVVRGEAGMREALATMCKQAEQSVPRLNVLDVQKQIRSLPKPVIAMVNGFAIGGGHVLHLVCDLTIASENAIFGQTGPKVGSFDAGFGASYLARIVGQKKAREIWFLCRQYSAAEALEMGMVNKVVPFERLEDEVVEWAQVMMERSPLALRMIKAGLNAELDGQAGIQELAGDATMLYYMLDEAQEGGRAFLEKRKPDFSKYPKLP